MKNAILYYYNFNDIHLNKVKNKNYIIDIATNKIYIFVSIENTEECIEAIRLTKNIKHFNNVVINIKNEYFTPYNGKIYILEEISEKSNEHINIYEYLAQQPKLEKFTNLDRNNWNTLWAKKIDYYEYQLSHINNQYKLIEETIDYYIGLTENAIELYNYAMITADASETEKIICHKRINSNITDVTNIIVDYREREIGEYLKSIFWQKNYNLEEAKTLINKYIKNETSAYLLFSRLLYPNYYFDIYDKILNSELNEKEILKIVERNKEYEKFLLTIKEQLKDYGKLAMIKWIKK